MEDYILLQYKQLRNEINSLKIQLEHLAINLQTTIYISIHQITRRKIKIRKWNAFQINKIRDKNKSIRNCYSYIQFLMIFNEYRLHGSSKCMHLNVSFKTVIIQHLISRVFTASILLLK